MADTIDDILFSDLIRQQMPGVPGDVQIFGVMPDGREYPLWFDGFRTLYSMAGPVSPCVPVVIRYSASEDAVAYSIRGKIEKKYVFARTEKIPSFPRHAHDCERAAMDHLIARE